MSFGLKKTLQSCYYLEIIICSRFLIISRCIYNRFINLLLNYLYYGMIIEQSKSNFSFFLFLTVRTKRTSILLSFYVIYCNHKKMSRVVYGNKNSNLYRKHHYLLLQQHLFSHFISLYLENHKK